jgi:hypothetical protein
VMALVSQLKPAEAAQLVAAAAQQVVEAMGKTNNAGSLVPLAKAMKTLAPQLEPEAAAASSRQAIWAMGNVDLQYNDLDALAEAVTALAPRLGSVEATRLPAESVRQSVAMLSRTNSPDTPDSLAKAVTALVPWLEPEAAAAIARQALEAMSETHNAYAIRALAKAVAALSSRLRPVEAAGLAAEAARLAVEVMSEKNPPHIQLVLAEAVTVLAPQLAPDEAARLGAVTARHALKTMGKTNDSYYQDGLAKVIAVLAPRLEPEDAARLATATRLTAETMEKASDPNSLPLANVVAALAARLRSEDAAQLAAAATQQAVTAMGNATKLHGPYEFAEAIAALGPWLDSESATGAARQTVEAIGRTTDPHSLRPLMDTVECLIVQAKPENTSRRTRFLALGVGNSIAPQACFVGLVPLAEASRPLPSRFTEQQLIDLLKMPTCLEPARLVFVRQLGWQCGQNFANQWELVEWARENRPDLDLSSPPVRPAHP